MLNKEKMKAKCEAWIKEGMGACRAPITTVPVGSKAHTQTIGHPMTIIVIETGVQLGEK